MFGEKINSETTHKLANEVEELIKLYDKHVKISKSKLGDMITSKVVKGINSFNDKDKRINCLGEEDTTLPYNVLKWCQTTKSSLF